MKKLYFLYTFLFFISACQTDIQKITDNEVTLALSVFIDSTVTVAQSDKKERFVISPEFIDDFKTERIQELENDTIFLKKDIDFMIQQYNALKKAKIKKYADQKYFSIIKNEKPKVGQRTYWISPPLYNTDKKYFVIYARMFFLHKNKIRWDDLSFLYKKEKNSYVLIGYLKWVD